jgi:hypothetical protein
MLSFDPYSGDYGTGFWGFAVNTATYVTHDAALGWLSFGGNLQAKSGVISVVPVDAFRTRVYLASAGLWLTLDAGKFRRITLDSNTGIVRLNLEPATKFTANARLRIDEPAKSTGAEGYRIAGRYNIERGAYVVPLGRGSTEVVLQPGATAPH